MTTPAPIVIHAPLQGDPARIATAPDPIADGTAPGLHAEATPIAPPLAVKRARIASLDGLRGLSLLGMNFAFAIPFAVLPAWMYHMQYPPPSGDYVAQAGLTWQDIIFPGFVFAMAAAIPIRNAQLLEQGESVFKILWDSLKRMVLLYLFALIIGHVNPFYTNLYNRWGNALAIAGFIACFAIFLRAPGSWSPRFAQAVRILGYSAAAVILLVLPPLWNETFLFSRRDPIIASIAFAFAVATLLWVLTRNRPLLRLVALGILAVSKLLAPTGGVFGFLLARSFIPAVYEPWYLELLIVAIPGLFAGEILSAWVRSEDQPIALSRLRLGVAALLGLAIPVVLLIGLYQRSVFPTVAVTVVLATLLLPLLRTRTGTRAQLLTRLAQVAAAFLVIGVLLEPLEGGIMKDPQTLGYLLLNAGLWSGLLLSGVILLDVVGGAWRRLATPIVLAGQNAMLAYVVFMLFINHVAWLAGFGDALTATAPQAALRGTLYSALVLAILWLTARYRVFWRS